MKQSTIDSILRPYAIPIKMIDGMIKNNMKFPIFKLSEKTTINPETNESEKTTDLICSVCSHRFTIYKGQASYPVCPCCGNKDGSYSPSAMPNLSSDFQFSKDIAIRMCYDKDETKGSRPTQFFYSLPTIDKEYNAHNIFIMDKKNYNDELFFILREFELFLDMSETTGKRTLILLFKNNAIIFGENEIVNVKNGKKSSATFSNTYYTYYGEKNKCLLADADMVKEFDERTNSYVTTHQAICSLSETNSPNFYISYLSQWDSLVQYIREEKPISATVSKRKQMIISILNTLPIPSQFDAQNDFVYYSTIETDEIDRSETIQYTCPHCKKLSTNVVKKHFYSYRYEENHYVRCEHCGSELDFGGMRDFRSENDKSTIVSVVENYEDGIAIYDWAYRVLVENGKETYIPITDGYRPKNVCIIKKEFDQNNILANIIIIKGDGYEDSYRIVKNLKFNAIGAHRILNEATNFNMQWSAIDRIDDELYNGFGHNSSNIDMLTAFVLLYRKYPVMEKFLKEGQSAIVKNIINSFCWDLSAPISRFALEEKDVASALKVSKGCLRILNKMENNKVSHFEQLQLLYGLDNNLTEEDYRYLENYRISVYKVADVCRKFGFSIHQICEYIERVRIAQCVEPATAMSEWADYLVGAELIGSDLTDRRVKYPSALRTEHDKVMYKKKIIENQDYEASFQKVTNEYGQKLSYKDRNFIITYPKTLTDLFEEGRILNHCVGTYGDSIKNGNSIILFVRKASEPDVPYFTLEVNPTYNSITQFYGHSDTPPLRGKHRDLIEFVHRWAQKHGITYRA